MQLKLFLLIVLSVSMSAVAQLFLKLGSGQAAGQSGAASGLAAMLMSPHVWMGLGLYGAGTLVWLFVLARAPLSLAYPFVGLGFVLTALLGAFVLHETITPVRIAGIALIAAGCVLVARTA